MSDRGQPPANAVVADLVRAALAAGQQPWLTITSHSMRPLLQPGDAVQVVGVSAESLPPGAVVVVDTGPLLLTHRYLVTVPHDGAHWLITRGDRPWALDAPWPTDALVGRVVARRRGGRTLDLTHGTGAWLDRVLRRLLALELALLAPRARHLTWNDVADPFARRLDRFGPGHAVAQHAVAQHAAMQRVVRALLYRMAWLATWPADRSWRRRPETL